MIPSHLSLVPLHEGRRAALRAIGEVENKIARGIKRGEYPWAKAFFRHLTGRKRITIREINYFSATLTERELRGRKDNWISAIDTLIESRGTCCYLPLGSSAAHALFPETLFKEDDRFIKKLELKDQKYTRQENKEKLRKKIAYQALIGQAEIDLAFHTPETVKSWSSRWRQTEINEGVLDDMFFRWSERFPSLARLECWHWHNEPNWALMYEVQEMVKEATPATKVLECWMVPNKLTCRESMHEAKSVEDGVKKRAKYHSRSPGTGELRVARYTVILSDHSGYADYRVSALSRPQAIAEAFKMHYEMDTQEEREERVSERSHQAEAIFIYAGWPRHV